MPSWNKIESIYWREKDKLLFDDFESELLLFKSFPVPTLPAQLKTKLSQIPYPITTPTTTMITVLDTLKESRTPQGQFIIVPLPHIDIQPPATSYTPTDPCEEAESLQNKIRLWC
jgi:hypothetical protein